MAGVHDASPVAKLTPIGTRGPGPSGRVAFAIVATLLLALVGVSLADQAGAGPSPAPGATAGTVASTSRDVGATLAGDSTHSPAPTPCPGQCQRLSTLGDARIDLWEVRLVGRFFRRATDEPDVRRGKGLVVGAGTIIDDRFLAPDQQWDEGAVWWEEGPANTGPAPWIWLGLGRAYLVSGAIVQADNNDSYRLSFRNLSTGAWESMWDVPPSDRGGLVTRPNPADDMARYVLPEPVVTDALRFEAAGGDRMYSVSEIQVFGTPAQYPPPPVSREPTPAIGTPPPRVALDLGPVRVCPRGSTPDVQGRAGQARPPLTYTTDMAFDRSAGRIVLVVASDEVRPAQTWTFDVCTNEWTRMHPAQQPSAPGDLVYDADSDVTIMVGGGPSAWAYDLEADTWSAKASLPYGVANRPLLAYDPVTGLVVVDAFHPEGKTELWQYDVDSDVWMWLPTEGASAEREALIAYDASVDRLISYEPGARRTDLLDLRTGTVSVSGALFETVNAGWGGSAQIAYDEARHQTIVFSDARVIAYDALDDRWEVLRRGTDPGSMANLSTGSTARIGHSMVYDAINQRIVVYGGMYRTSNPETDRMWVESDDVLAFDAATHKWTTLLSASRVAPPGP